MSAEENRRRMEANQRRFETENIKRQRAAGSPLFNPPSLLEQVSGKRSPTTSGLPPTPQQIRFTAPYGSREPFSSPTAIDSESSRVFTAPYTSFAPFGSPDASFQDPLSSVSPNIPEGKQRHPSGKLRPTDLSSRFSSVQTSGSVPQIGSESMVLSQQQTEPSVRPKVRTQRVTEQPTPMTITTSTSQPTSSYDSFAPYDPFLSSYTEPSASVPVRGVTQAIDIPSSGRRRHSAGDISSSDDLTQRMSELSFGASDYQYTLKGAPPDLSSQRRQRSPIRLTPKQSEPSVRPKVRTRLAPTGSPPPSIDNRIPEPGIVHRYRHPITGEPDPQRLRQPARLLNPTQSPVFNLANLSRQQIREVMTESSRKGRRKREYLEGRGFQPTEFKRPGAKPFTRYSSSPLIEEGPPQERPKLVPRRPIDLANLTDPRFNKPQSAMDRKPLPHPLGPVGRQGYGPLPRRALSMPDLSSPDFGEEEQPLSNLDRFGVRYMRLKPKHQDYYKHYRQEITWHENPSAHHRMVKAPTLMTIADQNKRRLSEISSQRFERLAPIKNRKTAKEDRRERRQMVGQSAVLPASLEDARGEWLAQLYFKSIPEENDEDLEEEE